MIFRIIAVFHLLSTWTISEAGYFGRQGVSGVWRWKAGEVFSGFSNEFFPLPERDKTAILVPWLTWKAKK
jgi:hypothetical protein